MIDAQAAALLARVLSAASEQGGDSPRPGPEAESAYRALAAVLDEIDYGVLLVAANGDVVHLNHSARTALASVPSLTILHRTLWAHNHSDNIALKNALSDAAERGRRHMLTIGRGDTLVNLAVVPLTKQGTLILLGRRELSESLSLQFFARQRGLTAAETRVLGLLCDGHNPRRAAEINGVGLRTIRGQIAGIREKTGAQSIRDLLCQVAKLPPMMSSLRAEGSNVSWVTAPLGRIDPSPPSDHARPKSAPAPLALASQDTSASRSDVASATTDLAQFERVLEFHTSAIEAKSLLQLTRARLAAAKLTDPTAFFAAGGISQ